MNNFEKSSVEDVYEFATDIFPINRSLTGNGVRETLRRIQRLIPDLKIHEAVSGSKVYDWVVPKEWNIESA